MTNSNLSSRTALNVGVILVQIWCNTLQNNTRGSATAGLFVLGQSRTPVPTRSGGESPPLRRIAFVVGEAISLPRSRGGSIGKDPLTVAPTQQHGQSQETEGGVVGSHAGVIRPAPQADEPIQHQHEIREEEQPAGHRHGSRVQAGRVDQVADGLAQHGGDDEGIHQADRLKNRLIEVQKGAEQQKGRRREKDPVADGAVEEPDPLQDAVGRHKEDMPQGKGGRPDDEVLVDETVPQKGQDQPQGHGDIEGGLCPLGRKGVDQIDHPQKSEQTATGTLQGKVEAMALVHVIESQDGGDEQGVHRKQELLMQFHGITSRTAAGAFDSDGFYRVGSAWADPPGSSWPRWT